MAELPANQAEVLALRVLGGLEVAEVARIVGNARGRSGCWPAVGCGAWAQRMETAGLARV